MSAVEMWVVGTVLWAVTAPCIYSLGRSKGRVEMAFEMTAALEELHREQRASTARGAAT
jgi:hypothetical protein